MVRVYSDASFDDLRKVSGIGCVLIRGQKRKFFSNWRPTLTNNEGELYAIWFALNLCAGEKVTLYTDSQNAINYITGRTPKEKPYMNPKQVENRNRCRFWAYKIKQAIKNLNSFNLEHIKAHTNKFQQHFINNQLADILAKEGRAKFYESNPLPIHKKYIKSR